ncbi:multidrug effflux MFS transporter [Mucilaginibacter pocheonensis]|uniref:DHA1 family bicyclomycin/chloramphenicol resistance-like MFS transporter n=1 Tax=Mucilaginibacter pocheonensis TaxID=398050 RepID=A0ABU1TEF8_9SPHI|nr:multidrug effflux MFS transporter [Mucilaginibacter pocheonensis]MDR6943762.1 DHA1 family bicyclomycin/chloramphenicol resistance-like MFS transporter [Mucilaginibacter pocheonensis]
MIENRKNAVLLTLGGLAALAPFSIDMYLPGFPQIANTLHTDIAHVSFSLTSYFIGISFGQLVYGPITDKFGRRKPLMIGLLIFIIAALGCALSTSVSWLVAMRVILAFGGCAGMVTGTAAVRDIFPKSEVAKIFSILMLILGLGPVIAPTLGGAILTISNWHFIFYFLAFFGLLLLIMINRFLPEFEKLKNPKRLTFVNVFRDYQYVIRENNFLFFALASSTAVAAMFAYISSSPFVFIKYFKFSELQYSFIFAFNALGFIAGSQWNRRLIKQFDSLNIIYCAGALLLAVPISGLILLNAGILNPPITIALIFILLFSIGLLIPNCTAMALSGFTVNAGVASALVGSFQMILSAISSWFVSYLFDGTVWPMVIGLLVPAAICALVLLGLKLKNKKVLLA